MSIWIIALMCLIPLFLFTGLTKKLREKHSEMFGYILSLAGTFIGVFVGLYITGIQANNDRKDLTVKVLDAGKKEMSWLIQRCDRLLAVTDSLSFRHMQQLHDLESPAFFSTTMRSELMAEMLDPFTIEEFNRIKEKMFFDIELTKHETARGQRADFINDLKNYREHLTLATTVMDEEIARLKGKVSTKSYEAKAIGRLDSFTEKE